MKRSGFFHLMVGMTVASISLLAGCGSKGKIDEAAAAPPPAKVETLPDVNIIQVDRPERFALVSAGSREDVPELHVTGAVSPDVSREVPVVSLASGRVVDLKVRLGDQVTKGQFLFTILSFDISSAFADYNKAKADEELARKQLERAKLLLDHGAIAQSEYEIAFDTEQKAKVELQNAAEHIHTLGANVSHEDAVVKIFAPISGTIIDQQITTGAAVKTPDNQTAGLLTVADLSRVWILCDVYENDLSFVKIGDMASIKLNAYPDRILQGRVSNIGALLDPNIRSAKVRLELANPGMMRFGMFATATFFGRHGQTHATVPASAVLHLHDRDWVYVPDGQAKFRRVGVTGGSLVDGKTQDVISGLSPGQQVVVNALALSAENQE